MTTPEPPERRRVSLLVPRKGDDVGVTPALLVSPAGTLPALLFELPPGETTIGVASRRLDELGLRGPVIDCFIDQTPTPLGEPVGAVIELAPLADAPDGLEFRAWDEATIDTSPGLAQYAAERIEEWRGVRPVPEQRAAWGRPGWYERATAWIDAVLTANGLGRAIAVTPMRHWGISAVMRIETDTDRYWFKAVAPLFATEPAITEYLHRTRPGIGPEVIGVDLGEGWLLLGELRGQLVAVDPSGTDEAIRTLVALQHECIGHTDDLLRSHVASRPLATLVDDLAVALQRPYVVATLRLEPARVAQLLAGLTAAIDRVDELGLPHTLVHGDFHPGNVIVTADGIRIFDWSDAAVSHPLIDVAVWTSWFEDDPARGEAVWRGFADAWSDLADPAAVLARRVELDAITGAYHLISYMHILEGLEPARRAESLDGLTGFFARLDAAVPR